MVRSVARFSMCLASTRLRRIHAAGWRYDGYGEHADGAGAHSTGRGSAEDGHYSLVNWFTTCSREDRSIPQKLLGVLESFANDGGLVPEQVLDTSDIPDRELQFGRPSGSAMPLVWAHAEYLKLHRALGDGRLFDLPPQTVQRYLSEKTVSARMIWRFNGKIRSMPAGKTLRIETLAPASIHWSADGWSTVEDTATHAVGLGIHIADLTTAGLPAEAQIRFTIYWPEAARWEGTDFIVRIET
jgi:glucoamylase